MSQIYSETGESDLVLPSVPVSDPHSTKPGSHVGKGRVASVVPTAKVTGTRLISTTTTEEVVSKKIITTIIDPTTGARTTTSIQQVDLDHHLQHPQAQSPASHAAPVSPRSARANVQHLQSQPPASHAAPVAPLSPRSARANVVPQVRPNNNTLPVQQNIPHPSSPTPNQPEFPAFQKPLPVPKVAVLPVVRGESPHPPPTKEPSHPPTSPAKEAPHAPVAINPHPAPQSQPQPPHMLPPKSTKHASHSPYADDSTPGKARPTPAYKLPPGIKKAAPPIGIHSDPVFTMTNSEESIPELPPKPIMKFSKAALPPLPPKDNPPAHKISNPPPAEPHIIPIQNAPIQTIPIQKQQDESHDSWKKREGIVISIPKLDTVFVDGKQVKIFVVQIQQGHQVWTIQHRYSFFHMLNETIKRRCPSEKLPSFPGKKSVANALTKIGSKVVKREISAQENMLESRRKTLATYLQDIINLPATRDLDEVKQALLLHVPFDQRAKLSAVAFANLGASPMPSSTPAPIAAPIVSGPAVFGIMLEDALNLPDSAGRQIPRVVECCVEYIERCGLQSEGVFRLSAMTSELNKVKALFNNNQPVNFDDVSGGVDVAAGILKLYLRELPEPLFTFDLYDSFCEISSFPAEARVEKLRNLIRHLPYPNYTLLKYLVEFLTKVIKYSDVNKMHINNIVTIFGPAWLRQKGDEGMSLLVDCTKVLEVCKLLIEQAANVL